MNLFKQIENDIQSKKFSPIYLLMGEEEFYINKITNLIINNSISESEKEFNLNILYGKDTSVDEIISICKKFPLMSKFQLVVIKEAQDLSRTIDQLTVYTNNFLDSIILGLVKCIVLNPSFLAALILTNLSSINTVFCGSKLNLSIANK